MAQNAELAEAYFSFSRALLVQQWRWFVASSAVPDARGKREKRFTSEVSKMHFYKLMEVLLSGLDVDPRRVLKILGELARLHDLYRLAAFRDDMRPAFIQKLIAALVDRAYVGLDEELIDAVHALASVDFADFFKRVKLFGDFPRERDAFAARDRDAPSFALALCAFCDDVRLLKNNII